MESNYGSSNQRLGSASGYRVEHGHRLNLVRAQGFRQLVDESRARRVDRQEHRVPLISTLIVSLITSTVLAGAVSIAHKFYGGNFLVDAVLTAIFLWAGFTAARIITHDAFEGRPKLLTLLTISHELVTVVVMALIIGLIGA